jgi:hypothetical protein
MVAQLYPQHWVSLLVACYDTQGYGGVILLCPTQRPTIIRVTKSRRITCMKHVACIGEIRNTYAYIVLVKEPDWISLSWGRPKLWAVLKVVLIIWMP